MSVWMGVVWVGRWVCGWVLCGWVGGWVDGCCMDGVVWMVLCGWCCVGGCLDGCCVGVNECWCSVIWACSNHSTVVV